MSNHNEYTHDLLIGAVVGGVIGALAAFLIAPKSGRQLIDELAKNDGFFHKFTNQEAESYAQKIKTEGGKNPLLLGGIAGALLGAVSGFLLAPKPSRELFSSLADQFQDVTDKTLSLVSNINQKSQEIALGISTQTAEWAEKTLETTDHILRELLLWEDAVKEAANTVTRKAESMNEPDRRDRVLEVLDWAQNALRMGENVTTEVKAWARVVNDIAEKVRSHPDTFNVEPEVSSHASNARDILEWAALGVSLWQNIKKKR